MGLCTIDVFDTSALVAVRSPRNREHVVRQPKAVDALQLEPRAKHKSTLQQNEMDIAQRQIEKS